MRKVAALTRRRERPKLPIPADTHRIILIDPGCAEALGHHREVNEIIQAHCQARNLDIRILVGTACAPDVVKGLKAQAVLSPSVYVRVPPRSAKTLELLEALNAATYDELQRELMDIAPGDMVVLHTASHWHLAGIEKFARAHKDKNVKYRFLVRMPYSFSALQDHITLESEKTISEYIQYTVDKWKELDADVKFFTDTPALAQAYQNLTGIPFELIPIQVDFSECDAKIPVANPDSIERDITFVLAGNARREKGFDILPEAIDYYFRAGGRGTFVVQSIDSWEQENAARLAKFGSRVKILGQSLSRKDYFGLLDSGDAVLIAYDPECYQLRTSHILIEALGIGRPVITTDGTWMADELARFGQDKPGVIMKNYTSEDLGKALLEFSANASHFGQRARDVAQSVRDTHNAAAFLGTLLS